MIIKFEKRIHTFPMFGSFRRSCRSFFRRSCRSLLLCSWKTYDSGQCKGMQGNKICGDHHTFDFKEINALKFVAIITFELG